MQVHGGSSKGVSSQVSARAWQKRKESSGVASEIRSRVGPLMSQRGVKRHEQRLVRSGSRSSGSRRRRQEQWLVRSGSKSSGSRRRRQEQWQQEEA